MKMLGLVIVTNCRETKVHVPKFNQFCLQSEEEEEIQSTSEGASSKKTFQDVDDSQKSCTGAVPKLQRKKGARSKFKSVLLPGDPQPSTSKKSEEEEVRSTSEGASSKKTFQDGDDSQNSRTGAIPKRRKARKNAPKYMHVEYVSSKYLLLEGQCEFTTSSERASASNATGLVNLNMEDLIFTFPRVLFTLESTPQAFVLSCRNVQE